MDNNFLWNKLNAHWGHQVSIARYGNHDNPANVCLECEDCGSVILDAELYTLCAREDAGIRKAIADSGSELADIASKQGVRGAPVRDFHTRDGYLFPQKFKVTITETLQLTVEVEAEDQQQAEQMVSDNWHDSQYILDAENFVDVSFKAVPEGCVCNGKV